MSYASALTEQPTAQLSPGVGRSLPQLIEIGLTEAAFLFEHNVAQMAAATPLFSDTCTLFERIEAHLDLLRVAGGDVWKPLDAALESATCGLVFVATVLSLEHKNTQRLRQIIALAETDPALQTGLLQGFSWVPAIVTQPLLPHLLGAASTFYRKLGLHLCCQHQIHASSELERAVSQPDVELQALALNAIGEIGALDLLPYCVQRLQADELKVRVAAGRACLLLGEQMRALPVLQPLALQPSLWQKPVLTLLAASLPVLEAQGFLASFARQCPDRRLLIQLAGELGDSSNIPALLRLMQDPAFSRLAGLAFCAITGVDLVQQNMEVPAPPAPQAGPSDNPDDNAVASDPDEDLPWPDVAKLERWWSQNGTGFQPGQRYLAGQLMSREQCVRVLQHGVQSQRQAAALQLKIMAPGAPLFRVDAPAWRQQNWLRSLAHC